MRLQLYYVYERGVVCCSSCKEAFLKNIVLTIFHRNTSHFLFFNALSQFLCRFSKPSTYTEILFLVKIQTELTPPLHNCNCMVRKLGFNMWLIWSGILTESQGMSCWTRDPRVWGLTSWAVKMVKEFLSLSFLLVVWLISVEIWEEAIKSSR